VVDQSQCRGNGKGAGGSYDLAVIGAGSAGFAAMIAASEQGAQVALIGHGTIGGTCVNVGCVPSKTLIRAAEAVHQARAASRFAGIRGDAAVADWRALVAQKDELVGDLRQAKYADLLPAYNGVAYLEGRARLTSEGVAVDGEALKAAKVIIATGARPAVPAIPGIDEAGYLTSTGALALAELPDSLLVVGGGYIGCELAQLFARAGAEVTILCRNRLLPAAEPEIGEALADHFRAEGIAVRSGVSYRGVRRDGERVSLRFVDGGAEETLAAARILLATGRTPNTEDLGLAEAGVEVEANGGITVNDRMRTTRPGVYAAGDVTGRDQFVYMATYGARLAAENALNGDARRYDNTAMPSVVFTDPQVASVGLTEAEARARGLDVETSLLPLARSCPARSPRGMCAA
jgi:mercury(II) reductase